MPRSHRPSYPEFEVWSTSSSTSVDSEDEWYTFHHNLRPQPNRHGVVVHHHNPHHHHPHPHQHVQRPAAPITNVFPPAPPSYVSMSTEPKRDRDRERPYYSSTRRTRSVGGESDRNVYLGGRSTFPNLFVDIHNRNSDNDHDHSRNRDSESIYGSDRRYPSSYPQPTYAPAPYGALYGAPYGPSYAPSALGEGRASVNDRMSLDHGEVMNQQVYVGPYDRDRRGRRHHYDDWFVDSRGPSMDITTVQQTAVDKYVHDLRIAKEAQDAAVRQAKLDDKERAKEIEDVEDKAVRKYQGEQSDIKKKCDIAVFDYKQSEADKKADMDRAKKQWEIDQKAAEQKRNDEKKAWEVEQAKKKADIEAQQRAWEVEEAKKKKKKEDEEAALKAKIKADEEKKKKEEKEEKERLRKQIEIELLKDGLPPRVVEHAIDPKARCPPEPVYEEWYRRYFQPWDEGGRRWIRVHRRYIMPDTLSVYKLDWDWDRDDDNYIIIKRDYDNPGIDLRILIEHTRKHGWSHSQSPHSKYAYEVENRGWGRSPVIRRYRRRWS